MRYIRYAFLAVLGAALLIVALANRGEVTLFLLPGEIAEMAGLAPQITLPLFLVIFAGIVAGILIGFVWEWLREHKHRATAANEKRVRQQLEREVTRLKGPAAASGDDVLALLEGAKSRPGHGA